MVGHTGVFAATVQAVQTVDRCLAQLVDGVHALGMACVITADHGNAEQMREPDGGPCTTHSLNPVPLIVTAQGARLTAEGSLDDVAPTVLELMGMAPPPAMTGRSLLQTAPT
jgi:2,3-bisphosphoglycerate-independent phosphoglycerate mutase